MTLDNLSKCHATRFKRDIHIVANEAMANEILVALLAHRVAVVRSHRELSRGLLALERHLEVLLSRYPSEVFRP